MPFLAMLFNCAIKASGLLVRACRIEICASRFSIWIGLAIALISWSSAGVGSTLCICTTRSGKESLASPRRTLDM